MMSVEERPPSSSSTTSNLVVDPLLRDLSEKKQNFRRNVVSLAAELKEVRSRLACQEQSFVRETLTRQVKFEILIYGCLIFLRIFCLFLCKVGWSGSGDSWTWSDCCVFIVFFYRKLRVKLRKWKKK